MIISLLVVAGLSVWIYYCNLKVQEFLDKGNTRAIYIWLYTAMLSAVLITTLLIYSLRGQLIDVLNVFYR